MTTPRTIQESWHQLRGIVLDWQSPPQTWVSAGFVQAWRVSLARVEKASVWDVVGVALLGLISAGTLYVMRLTAESADRSEWIRFLMSSP